MRIGLEFQRVFDAPIRTRNDGLTVDAVEAVVDRDHGRLLPMAALNERRREAVMLWLSSTGIEQVSALS